MLLVGYMSKKRKVLIIDDELDNREFIEQILLEHFDVLAAVDGETGVQIARTALPDVILLDIIMPRLDGIAVCSLLRTDEVTKHIPIIMLTGSNDIDRRVQSFMTGADDFLSKPFHPQDLIARVHSKIRRIEERSLLGNGSNGNGICECGNLKLDVNKLEVRIDGQVITLSVLEFNLLKCFVENKDHVLSRERILELVWRDSIVSDRTVDTHIVSLRKKLNGFDHSISTIYGAGYVLKKGN